MTIYEDPFQGQDMDGFLPDPLPVEISYSDSATITVNPYLSASAVLTAIQVNDLARNISYTWVRSTTYPNGYWQNNMAGTGMTNAPAGQAPMVTPGNNLQIAASFQNMGSVAGNFTVTITNETSGTQITSQTISAAALGGTGATTLVTATMPNSAISITVAVTP